jgi:hypothetical protein
VNPRAALAILAAVVLLAGATELTRAGYSPDEEFTVFAVDGIVADGLPILPSGLLYDRGVAYSYASRLARAVSGSQLPAYRAVSLLSAVAAIAIVFALVRRLSSTTAALLAALLVATSIPFWAAATTGRFYALFFALYAAVLWCLTRTPVSVRGLIALAVFSRWTHELAFTLVAVPLACAILDTASERRKWLRAAAAMVGGLVLAQLLLFALHYLAPSSGETMIRRFFLWQVVNLFERPPDRQFGIAFVVMIVGWLIAPRRAAFLSVIALCFVAFIVAMSITREMPSQPLSMDLVWSVLASGSRYPLDMFWHIARTTPVTVAVAFALMIARLVRGDWPMAERAIHLLWLGWVLWFGVVESGITINYLLVPVSIMLVAIAVDLVAIAKGSDPEQAMPRGLTPPLVVVVALVVLAVITDQWRGEGTPAARLAAARPTIHAPGIDEIRNGLQATDRIACTDELGCLMLVGRIDAWLALDDYVRERFVVRQGDEAIVGVYTGVPAVLRPANLFSIRREGTPFERTLIVDVFKDYPIGNSRTWLPRAIEADGLQVQPLLETPQLRVLQVSPAESVAARQP